MDEILQLGDTGDNVKILQEKLKILGFYNAMITGSFGLATEVGVKAFQEDAGLDKTGVVDKKTWDSLFQYTEQARILLRQNPTLSSGSEGSYVSDLQTKLKALLYYTGPINGTFDLETENAVKRFQLNNNLTASGVVNNQTWSLLNSLYGNLNSCVLDNNDGNNNEMGNNQSTYIVEKNDTLYSIARRYNTTVTELKRLNNLTSDVLKVGQILKIPTTSENNYIKYTVQSGDTLYSIARQYNTTVTELRRINNLTSDILQIGQVLNIPEPQQSSYINYIVQSGDTLYSIARNYSTSVDAIKSLNNLSSNTLQIGQVLKIPITTQVDYIMYTVVRNDTLYSIARKYNTTVAAIKSLNNLLSDNLSIGQVLKIPV